MATTSVGIVGTSSARSLPLGALASWAGPGGGEGLELIRGAIASLTADAPLLDEPSTFVVHQIIAQRAAKVVLTIRDGDFHSRDCGRLTLSVRTVEGHVYRAMTKTGATSRQELAALLSQRDDKTP